MSKRTVAALLAAVCVSSYAEDAILRKGDNWLRLSDTACSHEGTLEHLLPEWREKFKNARAQINGRDWQGCWIVRSDGDVHVVFEDGEEGVFSMSLFKPDGA